MWSRVCVCVCVCAKVVSAICVTINHLWNTMTLLFEMLWTYTKEMCRCNRIWKIWHKTIIVYCNNCTLRSKGNRLYWIAASFLKQPLMCYRTRLSLQVTSDIWDFVYVPICRCSYVSLSPALLCHETQVQVCVQATTEGLPLSACHCIQIVYTGKSPYTQRTNQTIVGCMEVFTNYSKYPRLFMAENTTFWASETRANFSISNQLMLLTAKH